MTELSLDYETFSLVDIKAEGGGKYVRDPSTEILMLGWAIDDNPVNLWQPRLGQIPNELKDAMEDPRVLKWAFNAPFERGITDSHLRNVKVPRYSWRCTQFLSHGLAFTGSLDAILKQAGFPEHLWKNPDGKSLIRKFSMLQPQNRKVRRWYPDTAPEDWEKFCNYCRQDVEVERALRRWLSQFDPITEEDWVNWMLAQDINDRGVPVDRELIQIAMALTEYQKKEIADRMFLATGLDNPTSNAQLLPWLQARGVRIGNMQAPTLEEALAHTTDHLLAQVLQDKLWYSQTATSKWAAMGRMVCPDNTLKGMFVTGGASRTLREASRGINLQNLKRPIIDDMDAACNHMKRLDLDPYVARYPMMDILATTVRGGIAAPEGYRLVVQDLGSIESRVLGWTAGCRRINDIFAADKDTYKDFATDLFNVPYEAVTSEQRKFSKPPTLGCGYQLGGPGLVEYAKSMGTTMSLGEAKHAVGVFRRGYPEIPQMWYWLVDSTIETTKTWREFSGYKVRIYRDAEFLYIQLPSGRRLAYHKPAVTMVDISWVDDSGVRQYARKPAFSYMGINRFNLQWERISTHGGGLTENIVQAIARDILFFHMRMAANEGFDIRGDVHDEIITLSPAERAEENSTRLQQIMSTSPWWAPDLLLGASGYTGVHYRKD